MALQAKSILLRASQGDSVMVFGCGPGGQGRPESHSESVQLSKAKGSWTRLHSFRR